MSAKARIFVSYSERRPRTRAFVMHLLGRLNDHVPDLAWNYHGLARELAPGRPIEEACNAEIDRTSMFVAVVTEEALESPSVRAEVSHALEREKAAGLVIVPVLVHCPAAGLAPPFGELIRFKFVTLSEDSPATAETLCADLLALLGQAYQPTVRELRKFPLVSRTFAEVARHCGSDYAWSGLLDILRQTLTKVSDCRLRDDLLNAKDQMHAVVVLLDTVFRNHSFFYPRLASIVLDFQYANDNRHPDACKVALDRLAALRASAASVDANLPAAIAYVRHASGQHELALEEYLAAREMDGADPDIAYNIAVSLINLGRSLDCLDQGPIRRVFDEGMATRSRDDFLMFLDLSLLISTYREDVAALRRHVLMLPDDWRPKPDLAMKMLERIERVTGHDLTDTAERIAGAYLKGATLDDPHGFELRRHMAYVWMAHGRPSRGMAELARLMADFPRNPMSTVDAAVFSRASGHAGPTRDQLRAAATLRMSEVAPAMSDMDLAYYRGFARYLLGEREAATALFHDSGFGTEHGYEAVLARFIRPRPWAGPWWRHRDAGRVH